MIPNFNKPLRKKRIRNAPTPILRLWLELAKATHRVIHETITRIQNELKNRKSR